MSNVWPLSIMPAAVNSSAEWHHRISVRKIAKAFFARGCVLLTLAMFGCANVNVTRVGLDDYKTKGFRFYRPRPYLVVNKPFPVGGDDFYVYGTIDAKNRVVLVDAADLPDPVKQHFAGVQNRMVSLPFTSIGASGQERMMTQGMKPSGGAPSSSTAAKTPSSPTSQPSGSQTKSASKQEPTTQQSDLKTSSDPSTDPYEKLNDYLGVVYLPDFDEEYAMDVTSGLGKGSASISLKNGWMMEKAEWLVDNQQLGQFVYSNVTKFIDLATTVAEQAVAPGSAELSKLAQQGLQPNAEAQVPSVVLLRIRYALEATPGVYPLLKPNEYSHSGPTNGPAGSKRASVLLPLPPYTMVAYNYRTTVAIELIDTSPKAGGVPAAKSNEGGGQALSDADVTALKAWLTTNMITLALDDKSPPEVTNNTLIIYVTMDADAATLKKLQDAFKNNPPTLKASASAVQTGHK